jgi:hypothetical protein
MVSPSWLRSKLQLERVALNSRSQGAHLRSLFVGGKIFIDTALSGLQKGSA